MVLRRFYESMGTVHYGWVTKAEVFKGNEDKVPMPEKIEENRAFFEERSMMAFEKKVEATETTVWPEGVLLSQGPWLGPNERRLSPEASRNEQERKALPIQRIASVAKM